MTNDELEKLLKKALPLQEVYVSSEGGHYQIIAVGELFAGLSAVKKQQMVYAPLMDYISDNRIHAVTIKTFTPDKWERERALNGY